VEPGVIVVMRKRRITRRKMTMTTKLILMGRDPIHHQDTSRVLTLEVEWSEEMGGSLLLMDLQQIWVDCSLEGSLRAIYPSCPVVKDMDLTIATIKETLKDVFHPPSTLTRPDPSTMKKDLAGLPHNLTCTNPTQLPHTKTCGVKFSSLEGGPLRKIHSCKSSLLLRQ